MTGRPERREPTPARTDFESMTHEQLAALLDSAHTAGASHLAARLSKAASTISRIGSDLMDHVKSLEWQGEGGDAFRDWGGQTASSTLRLGQYAEVASRWMDTVSQAIAEAKAAMPDTSETARAKTDLADAHKTITALQQPGVHNDPDAQQAARTAHTDATAAQHRIDAVRHEAVQQLRKLAQTYEYSAQQVNGVQPPTFPPPAGKTGAGNWWVGQGRDVSPVSAPSSGGQSTGHAVGTTRSSSVPHSTTPAPIQSQGSFRTASHHTPVSQPVSVNIDSVDALPRTTTPSAPSAPATVDPPHRGVPQPNPLPRPPSVPSSGGREFGQVPPRRGPASGRAPQVAPPGRTVPGTPRLPREPGIVGGRPIASPARSSSSVPRGTVIGDGSTQGRTPMGRVMPPGAQTGPGSPAGTGMTGGRRLGTETGGVVGGRTGQPSRVGGRPFTAGGSGLVRPATAPGASDKGSRAGFTGSAGRSTDSRKDREKGQRPDYLTEDEETWTRESRRALPPVVD